MKKLHDILQPHLERLRPGASPLEVSELWGGSRALFLLELFRLSRRHLLVITAEGEQAEELAGDLRFFRERSGGGAADILTFPAWGMLPFEADSPDSSTVGERMAVLYQLITGGPSIVVAPAAAVAQKVLPWQVFADAVRTVTAGGSTDPDALADQLAATGYEHTAAVTRVGEFSRRGGIIDLFSPAQDQPVRIEFFGETVESLRSFDAGTQRSTDGLKQAVVLPVRELVASREQLGQLAGRLGPAAGGTGDRELRDQLREGAVPPGCEFLAPFLYPLETLFRQMPEGSAVALVEPEDVYRVVRDRWEKVLAGHAEEADARTLPQPEELYLDEPSFAAELKRTALVTLPLLGASPDTLRMDTRSAASLGVRVMKSQSIGHGDAPAAGSGTASAVAETLKRLREQNRVLLVCGTDDSAARVQRMFAEYGVPLGKAAALDDADGPWPVGVATGRLSAGFWWPALGTAVITDGELFGSKVHRPRPARNRALPFLSSFRELKPGDFVVHRDYGVGEYQGMTHIAVDGFETDFLTLRYEPDAKLYVPLASLDLVQKHVGAEGAPPKVDRLGAPAWARTKERVKKDILEMARGLAALYAAREAMHRAPLAPPDNLYREFEAAFPFEETEDQQRAIQDVLDDMQKERPMDRLVCGDVGFGKTEVALRAAFKAVEDGYQAAVIVPTTLLADQHWRTFRERLAPFSVSVEMLSRFRTKAEQQATLQGMKSGTVDIVIGTHRLLQRDVAFRNLGLLVIDEEHRFGVRHKERIKEMRKMVDVLALTATPIPRTLHLSLAGIRDLSIIQTPPLDRQSIQVVLARFGKRVVREAVQQELERGGQVFFVQNRVAGIERMAAFLQGLVPKAKIGVAHGQMDEDEIETVMARFVAGELNVLVTTTIIESGIDIPNANTIIINRADRFGLAELYQIKGRVGRSRRKAYAYLLTPDDEALSDAARTRLRAIQELSELGAGFQVAAQDLESRGAGNLLGRQQSGQIAAVGIDLYTQMVEEAMAELRGEETVREPDTLVNLRASAFLPEGYIGDPGLRLAAYKEISAVASDGELDGIARDLEDRFGALPEPARNLLDIMKVKLLAKAAGVSRVDGGPASVAVTFAESAAVSPDRVMALLKRGKGRITLVPERTIRISLPDGSLATAAAAVRKCLQDLG